MVTFLVIIKFNQSHDFIQDVHILNNLMNKLMNMFIGAVFTSPEIKIGYPKVMSFRVTDFIPFSTRINEYFGGSVKEKTL